MIPFFCFTSINTINYCYYGGIDAFSDLAGCCGVISFILMVVFIFIDEILVFFCVTEK